MYRPRLLYKMSCRRTPTIIYHWTIMIYFKANDILEGEMALKMAVTVCLLHRTKS